MKALTRIEAEALLESARDALDGCLDALALPRTAITQDNHVMFSESEYAMHQGQKALDEIEEVLRPIYD